MLIGFDGFYSYVYQGVSEREGGMYVGIPRRRFLQNKGRRGICYG